MWQYGITDYGTAWKENETERLTRLALARTFSTVPRNAAVSPRSIMRCGARWKSCTQRGLMIRAETTDRAAPAKGGSKLAALQVRFAL
jgi:hypothetical protein